MLMRVFRERLSICVCVSFPFRFEGGIWDSTVLIPNHCLSFYFSSSRHANKSSKKLYSF